MAASEVTLALASGSEEARSSQWMAGVAASFSAAADRAGRIVERCYRIGGQSVRLQFAGPALVPKLTPALTHLASSHHLPPALTVRLWDSASTTTTMPSPPWTTHDYRPRGEVQGYNDDQLRTLYDGGSGTLSVLENVRNLGYFWIRDAGDIPYYESGAPLREILTWWMSRHARLCLHGAAVGTRRGAALLVGRGGSGKSTTALACLAAGMLYVGDDYCLVPSDGTASVHSLYSSAKLDPGNLWRLPGLASLVSNADRLQAEKALLFLHEHSPGQTVPDLPLRVVLLPTVGEHAATRFSPASSASALLALAPSTVFQLGPAPAALQVMSHLVRRLPCYRLHLGTDLGGVADAIARVIAEA
jgi:hypothetical protein